MQNKNVKFLVQGAVIAAMYAALTYLASAVNLAYGGVQFRFSEALTVLAAFTPAAIPGLTIGCFLGNLGSPYGMLDILCGTLATLLAALCAYAARKITPRRARVPRAARCAGAGFTCGDRRDDCRSLAGRHEHERFPGRFV